MPATCPTGTMRGRTTCARWSPASAPSFVRASSNVESRSELKVQAEEDEEKTSHLAQEHLICQEKAPEGCSCSAKRNKSKCKAEHKHEGMEKSCQARWLLLLSGYGLRSTLSYQLCEIDRDQW